jgi:CelD/BcsL family acetyltransferase involved in cellulose biosynthesis
MGSPVLIEEDGLSAPTRTNRVEYAIYRDLAGVAAISREWDRLLAASMCNLGFASAEWYLASCRVRNDLEPWVVTAGCNGEVRAILPLAIDPGEKAARFPQMISDYNDVVARSDEPAVVADLLDYATGSGLCKKILLSRLRPDSNCIRALPLLLPRRQIRCDIHEIDCHYRIGLPSSFDDYLASRSKAFRTNVKQALRRLEAGDLTMRELLPPDFDPARLPEVFTSMASARQNEKSFFRRPDARAFIENALPAVFRKRGLIVYALFQGERVVGLYIHMVGGRSLGAWNGGFLPEVGRWSPGTLLLACGIKRAIDMRLPEYDFLEGREPYKEHWADERYPIWKVDLASNA